MPGLAVATTTIHSDEQAFMLWEGNEQIPFTDSDVHRIQRIGVVRGDRLVEWRDDLGDAAQWPHARTVFLLGGQIHHTGRGEAFETVGRLREIAEEMRLRTKAEWDEPYGFDQDEHRDWKAEYHNERERRATTHTIHPVGK